jgi:hypothetical protein
MKRRSQPKRVSLTLDQPKLDILKELADIGGQTMSAYVEHMLWCVVHTAIARADFPMEAKREDGVPCFVPLPNMSKEQRAELFRLADLAY